MRKAMFLVMVLFELLFVVKLFHPSVEAFETFILFLMLIVSSFIRLILAFTYATKRGRLACALNKHPFDSYHIPEKEEERVHV